MGLGNDERTEKLYWSISRMVDKIKDLDESRLYNCEESIQRIRASVKSLWHAFLGQRENGLLWILGGDADNPVTGIEGGPWSCAISHLCETNRGRKEPRPARDEFDPFNGYLDVQALIGKADNGSVLQAVYDIYRDVEFSMYALRRYRDEFKDGFKALDHLLSDLQGECFSVFSRNEAYGRAYVLNRTLLTIYGGQYPSRSEKDPVREFLLQECMHHHLIRPMGRSGSLPEIIKWDRWIQTRNLTPGNRIVLMMRIAGPAFQYEHQFKKLMTMTKNIRPELREEKLREEFDKCVRAHEKEGKEDSKRYMGDRETEALTVIHGHDAYYWARGREGDNE